MNHKKFNAGCQALIALAMAFGVTQTYAQEELWVLSETPPALGMVSMSTFEYAELVTFEDAGYATDLEIRGDEAIVVLENRVVKVDLVSGQFMAETELIGAQEATLLDDGTVVVTRGGLDDAWQPLDLSSYLVWLDGDDLSVDGELLPGEGPTFPSQEVALVEGKVYVAVNNGWSYTEEVGRLGCWDPAEGTYTEVDMGEGAENPVAIHALDGEIFTVNNGDWTGTSVSRMALADLASVETLALDGVSVGCNASALVDTKLAVQISEENGLRLLDTPTMQWEEGVMLNEDAPAAYSLAIHPQYGWTCAGVTDYATFGNVEIRTDEGELLATVPVGISPGTLVWRADVASSVVEGTVTNVRPSLAGSWDVLGKASNQPLPGMPAVRLERAVDGSIRKVLQVGQ